MRLVWFPDDQSLKLKCGGERVNEQATATIIINSPQAAAISLNADMNHGTDNFDLESSKPIVTRVENKPIITGVASKCDSDSHGTIFKNG